MNFAGEKPPKKPKENLLSEMEIGQFRLEKLPLICKMVRHLRMYQFCALNILNCALEVTYALYLTFSFQKNLYTVTQSSLSN